MYFYGLTSWGNTIDEKPRAQEQAKEFLSYLNQLIYWESMAQSEGNEMPNLKKHSALSAAIEDFLNE